ncbi:MAG: Rpn family recombination-promoting nuclease/putative transposase [Dysgonamonadaceae bacterium]|jgi:predicted transposase/invertase (TIGR01784 family)|nr:Rpn family recombination-promoting nuclease/putative transposase [Dysgonamonadaceae bacterium]
MARYLDPKYDLTFKRVFGEHKHLCISLINSMLPFEEGREVVTIEYETGELIPERRSARNSIVDVRCIDNFDRRFIVEMQMEWTESFMQRVLFNASKVYVKDLNKAEEYEKLTPVYSLNFLKENFEKSPEMAQEYFHHYKIVNVARTDRQIKGLEFVFIELQKFKPSNRAEKKLHELWLRFLTEINEHTQEAPQELLAQTETQEAIHYMEVGAFTDIELAIYDREKDEIMSARTLLSAAKREGLAEGEEIGIAKGREEGQEERQKLQQELSDKDRRIAELENLLTNKN